MPPQKRSAAAGATTSTVKRKRVSIGETSVIGEPDTSETHTSARPTRSSTRTPMYHSKVAETPPATKTTNAEVRKSRSAAVTESAAKDRARPAKTTTTPSEEKQSLGKPVGRPKKSASAKFTRVKSHVSKVQTAEPPKSGIGPAPKQRGRPKGSTTKMTAAAPTPTPADKSKHEPNNTTAAETANSVPTAEPQEEVDGLTTDESDLDDGHEDDGKQYWLMKAEPESRVKKGVDVKFSIDDLRNAKEPEGWDGMALSDLGRSRT